MQNRSQLYLPTSVSFVCMLVYYACLKHEEKKVAAEDTTNSVDDFLKIAHVFFNLAASPVGCNLLNKVKFSYK